MDKDYALFLASMVSNLLIDGILLFIFRAYIEGLIKHREKEYEHSESNRTHFYDLLVIANDATLDCILSCYRQTHVILMNYTYSVIYCIIVTYFVCSCVIYFID